MSQLGHDDPNVTLRIYAHTMAQEDGERRRLRELVGVAPEPEVGSVSPQERRVRVT